MKVSQIMNQKKKLVNEKEKTNTDEIKALLHKYRIEKVLLVDDNFHLRGMVTNTDILKAEAYPNGCKDDQGRLRVDGSVSVTLRYAGRTAGSDARFQPMIEPPPLARTRPSEDTSRHATSPKCPRNTLSASCVAIFHSRTF